MDRVLTDREWRHRQKMERKELDRYERGSRRTMNYEREKADAYHTVLKMRGRLESPYTFRHGGV